MGGPSDFVTRQLPGRDDEPPTRIEMAKVLERDAVVIGDGGDFVSYAGRVIDTYRPGCWMDPGRSAVSGRARAIRGARTWPEGTAATNRNRPLARAVS